MIATALVVGMPMATVAKLPPVDACLGVDADSVAADEWAQIGSRIAAVVAERRALFPSPAIESVAHEARLGPTRPSLDLDISAGHDLAEPRPSGSACLEPGFDWTARFRRPFLQAGADRMLSEAPTTPGIESSVVLEWYPDEARLRTTLSFAGPLDIPNGTCWIDDSLAIDDGTGTAVASGQQGVQTSPFAEGACGRFFDHLPEGGAGEQAVTLFPTTIEITSGRTIRFVATAVTMTAEEIVVAGTLESP